MIYLVVLLIVFIFLDDIIEALRDLIGINDLEERIDELSEENISLIDENRYLAEKIAREDRYNGWAEK